MRTPQAVIDATKALTVEYASKFYHIGHYNGYEIYTLRFLEEIIIGLPEIYLYKEGEDVITVQGHEAIIITREAERNTGERRRAARLAKDK